LFVAYEENKNYAKVMWNNFIYQAMRYETCTDFCLISFSSLLNIIKRNETWLVNEMNEKSHRLWKTYHWQSCLCLSLLLILLIRCLHFSFDALCNDVAYLLITIEMQCTSNSSKSFYGSLYIWIKEKWGLLWIKRRSLFFER
jgi:hypothetical protein